MAYLGISFVLEQLYKLLPKKYAMGIEKLKVTRVEFIEWEETGHY